MSVLSVAPLGFVWTTIDPFLFCVHHDDAYPAGNASLGPAADLGGRDLGQDFAGKDGWRMYHGMTVPGFPSHPHRGFETVTIARRGFIDHSDSLGAAARFGQGDVQWMTAGAGVVHSEMFPLLNQTGPNPAELFQIWMNLPSEDKMAPPHFSMLWSEQIPVVRKVDHAGGVSEITVVAGGFEGAVPPPAPPHSWASRPDADVAIWTIRLSPGARLMLPAAKAGTERMVYLFAGGDVQIAGRKVAPKVGARVVATDAIELVCGAVPSELVVLQGRPIGQPVAQHGPFVMNTRAELQQAFNDYQRTRFGGWPWPSSAPVHPATDGRFARRTDGTVERP